MILNPNLVQQPSLRLTLEQVSLYLLQHYLHKGTSTIHNIEQIDRGYEDIENRLKKLAQK